MSIYRVVTTPGGNPTLKQYAKGYLEGLGFGLLAGFFIDELIFAGIVSTILNVAYDAYVVPKLPFDPPLPTVTTGLNVPFPNTSALTSSTEINLPADETGGKVVGNLQAPARV